MNFYDSAFFFLVAGCVVLSWRQYYNGEKSPEEKALNQPPITPRAKAEASEFTRLFLTVYCLVMGSDWLQGMLLIRAFELLLINYRSIRIQLI